MNTDLDKNLEFNKGANSAILLGLILVLGTALRLYNLGTESYWVDEIFTIYESQQSYYQIITSGRLDQPLTYYLPLHLWVRFFGTAEVSTRAFSALTGVGSIALIYFIGRELFSKGVGLLSALLMAISEFQIFFSQEARYYSIFEFTTLLSFLFLIPALRGKRKIYFIIYGIASILMIHSHAHGIFILAGQNLFFILQVKKYKNLIITWLICQTFILLALAPFLYAFIFTDGGIEGAAALNTGKTSTSIPPSLWDPLRSIYRFILSPRHSRNWQGIFGNYAIAAIFFVIGTWAFAFRQGMSKWVAAIKEPFATLQKTLDAKNKLLLVCCWLVFPIMIPFVLSFMIVPMYSDRYVISAAPASYLLLAYGILSFRKVIPLILSFGVLAIIFVPGLRYYYATDLNQQWKEAAAYVEENAEPGEIIVFAPNNDRQIEQKSFNWYYSGSLQNCGVNFQITEPTEISEALMHCASGYDHFWVIIGGLSPGRYKSVFLNPSQTDIRVIKEQHFVQISIYLFETTK